MRLKKIKLKNIRSYEEQEVHFPEGSLLLSGDVGSGKSSILLAIEYALFGLQPGQTGSALLKNGHDVGGVMLEIEADGQEIIIERRLKRGTKSVTNDYAALSVNGEKKDYSITELKTRILEVLGYPTEFLKKNNLLYRYTVYTPQEQMKQIILEDPETRLNVLRHIFGIDKYKLMRENLGFILAHLKDEIKMLQMEIKSLEEDKQGIQTEKEHSKSLFTQIEIKEKELQEKILKRTTLEFDLSSLGNSIKEKEKLETELEKTKVMLTGKKDVLYSSTKEAQELEKTLKESSARFQEEDLKKTISEIRLKKIALDKLQTKFIDVESQIKNFEQTKREHLLKKERVFSIRMCPTCLQDVPEVHKHNILNETEGILVIIAQKLAALAKEKEESITTIEKEKIDLIQLEERKFTLEILKTKDEEREKTKKRLNELLKVKDSQEKDVSLLEKHMEGIKQDIMGYAKFYAQFKTKQEELNKAVEEEKRTDISIAELRKEKELTEKRVAILESLLAEKEKAKTLLAERLDLSDWLSNKFLALLDFTEKTVMIKLRNEFSKLFSKWFQMLAKESFDTQLDENFTPVIMQGEYEMDYSFLSGGERTAVALAYRLALNQTINSVMSQIKTRDIVILDEPTDGFSEAQIDRMRDVLEELSIRQLILVSHEQKMDSFVDTILKLKKEGETSEVVGDSRYALFEGNKTPYDSSFVI